MNDKERLDAEMLYLAEQEKINEQTARELEKALGRPIDNETGALIVARWVQVAYEELNRADNANLAQRLLDTFRSLVSARSAAHNATIEDFAETTDAEAAAREDFDRVVANVKAWRSSRSR